MDDLDAPPAKKSPWDDTTKTLVGVLVALVVVLIVAGIGIATIRDTSDSVRQAVATTTTSVASSSSSTAPVRASDLTPAQAKVVEEIKAQVASIRGLQWKGTLPIRVISKDALAERVRRLNAEELVKNREELSADESVLKLLQLIGKDVDYAKTIDSLLAGGVLGYYDDEAKELFVGSDGGDTLDPATRVTLAHELTHALTDQYFDFGTRTQVLDDQNKTEEGAAFSALIEGDAELTAALWQEKHLNARERQQAAGGATPEAVAAYSRAPRYLLESLFFPYQDGQDFVRARHRAGGFAEVNKAYQSPPTSTEHILHPETFAAGQPWTPPAIPDLAAATGCGKVETGTLGEFDMVQVLAAEITRTEARAAAAGWNGDAFAAVRCGSALGLADRWHSDDAAGAGRLADALGRWARGWSGSTRATDAEGRISGPDGSARVVRTGDRVDIILADNAETVDRLARVVLAP